MFPKIRSLFLHPRRVNCLALLGLIATEAVGEGETDGAEAGKPIAHILTCPMILGSDHHCLEEVVAVEDEDGVATEAGIAETEVEIARCRKVERTLIGLGARKAVEGEREVVAAHKTESGVGRQHGVGYVAVERAVEVVAVLHTHPFAEDGGTRVEPPCGFPW